MPSRPWWMTRSESSSEYAVKGKDQTDVVAIFLHYGV